jgi:hypothetical protein
MDPVETVHEDELLGKLTAGSVIFVDWLHGLRGSLRRRELEHILDTPVPEGEDDYSPRSASKYPLSQVSSLRRYTRAQFVPRMCWSRLRWLWLI